MTLEEIRRFGQENQLSIQITLDYDKKVVVDVLDFVSCGVKRYNLRDFLDFAKNTPNSHI